MPPSRDVGTELDLASLLGPEGPLARQVPGFTPRAPQQAMAEAVAEVLRENEILIVEAGTGTGKTYAYLVPTLLSGKRVIISTGTRNLQDQLFYKDLPVVRRALGVSVRTAMLKGRANYLCRHRFNLTEEGAQLANREQVADLVRIRDWAARTRSGDITEVPGVPEDSPVWPRVTSTVDNCLGQECPCFQDCYVVKARREAQEADILVINHHLFFADMALKQEAFAELLPGADAFILDEAHQLPALASQFFGLSMSSRQLVELARDTVAEHLRDASDFVVLRETAQRLEHVVAELRLALGRELRRALWNEVAALPEVMSTVNALGEVLEELRAALEKAAERGQGLESCFRRAENLAERLTNLLETDTQTAIGARVLWFETYSRSFTLSLTPLDIAPAFRERMQMYQSAWVFTSATLAVEDDFEPFAAQLGLESYRTLHLGSPFDFARNAVLYHPEGLPEPSSPYYTAALVEAVLPVLEASRGRAFFLFTSHRALREAAVSLEQRLRYPVLTQGSLPKGELLDRFRTLGNAVLLGTSSFWEGVDVRGETLSCVVIAKLPFASPGDPVLQARIEAMRRRGGNPFLEYQLPHAVIALKQGVGRLIRDVDDRGVLMLCDPRLLSKAYGQVFLKSLPPMSRTRKLERVQHFFSTSETIPQSC